MNPAIHDTKSRIEIFDQALNKLCNDHKKCLTKLGERPDSSFWKGEKERIESENRRLQAKLKDEYDLLDELEEEQQYGNKCNNDDISDFERSIRESISR